MRKLSFFMLLVALLCVGIAADAANYPAVEARTVEAAPTEPQANICPTDAAALNDPLMEAEEATHGSSCPWEPNLFCDCIPEDTLQKCVNCCNNAAITCEEHCTTPLCVYQCEQNGAECTNQCYIHWGSDPNP